MASVGSPQLEKSHDRQPSTTDERPLHPEIRSIVSLVAAHAEKIYFSGPLVHKLESNPYGRKPHKDEGWRDIWAQLGGTTLSIWDMVEVKKAHREGREVPPSYVNITDAFVRVIGAVAQPATPNSPPCKYTNIVTLNTAGTNLLLFSCPSTQELFSWVAAFRLSCWEKSRLEEIYTAHLIRITLNDGRNTPSTLTDGRLEGWVWVRIAGRTDWKRLWMCVSAGTISSVTRSSTDVASISSKSPLILGHNRRHSSYVTSKKHLISGLFSQEKSPGLLERARISLHDGPRRKDKNPVLTFEAVTQAFAVYPERPKLITSSTLFKLEGTYGDEQMCANMRGREGCMLLMSDSAGVSWEMQKWLIAIHDAFELYGRPELYEWNPWDSGSMMFAYPIAPHKQLLFLNREVVEAFDLDPREDRTSVIRSELLKIVAERLQGKSSPRTRANQCGNSTPRLPPIDGGLPSQKRKPSQVSDPPAQRLDVLSVGQARQQQQQWDDNQAQPPPPYSSNWRALTPITERSTGDSSTGSTPPPL